MVLRYHNCNIAVRHRGCQTATLYVEPTRLVSTEHLVRLSRWPVSYLHARALDLNLANQPWPSQSQARRIGCEQTLCRAQDNPACAPPLIKQLLPSRWKGPASLNRASPRKRGEQPPWDSSVSWTCGHSPRIPRRGQPSCAVKEQVIPEDVTGCVESSCQVVDGAKIHQPDAMCEKGIQTSASIDRGTQTVPLMTAHLIDNTLEQAAKQESAVPLHQKKKYRAQQHCCCCCCCWYCATPLGLAVDSSRSARMPPPCTRPAWRCSSLKPGWRPIQQASNRDAATSPRCQVWRASLTILL